MLQESISNQFLGNLVCRVRVLLRFINTNLQVVQVLRNINNDSFLLLLRISLHESVVLEKFEQNHLLHYLLYSAFLNLMVLVIRRNFSTDIYPTQFRLREIRTEHVKTRVNHHRVQGNNLRKVASDYLCNITSIKITRLTVLGCELFANLQDISHARDSKDAVIRLTLLCSGLIHLCAELVEFNHLGGYVRHRSSDCTRFGIRASQTDEITKIGCCGRKMGECVQKAYLVFNHVPVFADHDIIYRLRKSLREVAPFHLCDIGHTNEFAEISKVFLIAAQFLRKFHCFLVKSFGFPATHPVDQFDYSRLVHHEMDFLFGHTCGKHKECHLRHLA